MSREPRTQILFDIHNHNVNLNLRDIYLHAYFKQDEETESELEFRQSVTFVKNLHVLDQPPYKPILVHLQSPGGDWFEGMAIFNAVQFATSYVTMLAYASTQSMAGIILQSAELRILMPDICFMMHHGWSGGAVNHPFAIKTQADFEDKICKRMLQLFAERAIVGPFFKKKKSTTVQTIYSFFDKKIKEKVDWYLDAEEAVWYGLADSILGSKEYPGIDSLRGE